MTKMAVRGRSVGFKVGKSALLQSVDIDVPLGSFTVLLGPNGSGKTTTIKAVGGLLSGTTGSLEVFGADVTKTDSRSAAKIRQKIGFQADTNIYPRLSALENVSYWAEFYGLSRSTAKKQSLDCLELLGLASRAADKAGSFSKGMRQKILIARALVSDPEFLILDEPLSGLDPEMASDVLGYVKNLQQHQSKTILMSSHRLQAMEDFATDVVLLSEGVSLYSGSLEELQGGTDCHRFCIRALDSSACEKVREILAAADQVSEIEALSTLKLQFQCASLESASEILGECITNGLLVELYESKPTVEEMYFRVLDQTKN